MDAIVNMKEARELKELLEEAAQTIADRAHAAADGMPYIEKELALQICGGAMAVMCDLVSEHYSNKTVSADGFEQKGKVPVTGRGRRKR